MPVHTNAHSRHSNLVHRRFRCSLLLVRSTTEHCIAHHRAEPFEKSHAFILAGIPARIGIQRSRDKILYGAVELLGSPK